MINKNSSAQAKSFPVEQAAEGSEIRMIQGEG